MTDVEILQHLMDLADEVELAVRVIGRMPLGDDAAGELPPSSAVCKVRGDIWVVLSKEDTASVHIDVLARALRAHASPLLEQRHLPPAVRARINPGGSDDFSAA